ncbi:triphosphoribosyl-dephospho-CoA synthase [Salmonella enterica subsp. enterica]|nr:triphosphoribosyl-dephospho-CoA synthase [Salmonella enterica subsp. enterica]
MPAARACHQSQFWRGPASIGMACEAAMFRATAGVNTHKASSISRWVTVRRRRRLYQLRQPTQKHLRYRRRFCRGSIHA